MKCLDRVPLVWVEMTGIKQVTCNITSAGRGGKWKRDFSLQSPPKLFQTKCSVFPNSNVLCHLKNMVFITAIKKWKCNQVKLWSLECTPFWSVAHTSGKKKIRQPHITLINSIIYMIIYRQNLDYTTLCSNNV